MNWKRPWTWPKKSRGRYFLHRIWWSLIKNNVLIPNYHLGDVHKTNECRAIARVFRGCYRCLIDAELQAKHVKGLCYRCEEKYYIGRCYENLELQVLVRQYGELEDNWSWKNKNWGPYVQFEAQTIAGTNPWHWTTYNPQLDVAYLKWSIAIWRLISGFCLNSAP